MESLLIFVAIFVIDAVIKNIAKKKKQRQPQKGDFSDEDTQKDFGEFNEESKAPKKSLQDLVRQFEEAQRQAAQGNIEPSTPPVEAPVWDNSKPLTLRNIAHFIAENEEEITIEYLTETFGVDIRTAQKILLDLQNFRIVGRDMGEGYFEVLAMNKEEAEMLLNKKLAEDANEHDKETQKRELERQKTLKELEERAKLARQNAQAINNLSALTEEKPKRKFKVKRNLEEARKGFIWAKILDEPRFKKHWSTRYR